MADLLLGAIQWDPHIRGGLIFVAAVLILPGSVYLLLGTNLGVRIGFVVAAAGLAGWMFLLGLLWTVYGIGPRGAEPHWDPKEVITGDVSATTLEALEGFPEGWEELPPGHAVRADAQATADHVLAPSAEAGGHGEGGAAAEPEATFESPFSSTEDYVIVNAWRKGGENYFPGGIEHDRGFLHRPHHVIIQVQPVLPAEGGPGGPPPRPAPDPTEPVTSVIVLRDLGNLRFPPFLVMTSSFVVFAVLCWWLHQRDKEIWARRQVEPAGAT